MVYVTLGAPLVGQGQTVTKVGDTRLLSILMVIYYHSFASYMTTYTNKI